MRASACSEISTVMHQQGSLEPATIAHEFDAPHTGQREGSTPGLRVMPF